MKWFGEDWGAPCCDERDHVPTPTGEICLGCGRVIEPGAAGFLIPLLAVERTELRAWHLDCLLGNVGAAPKPVPGLASALHLAHRIATDPSNRAISCGCGVTYLSGAAEKDSAGRPTCLACGVAHEASEA